MAQFLMALAQEADQIAGELIPAHHVHLDLTRARIVYVFTSQKRRKCDRVRLGSAAKMSSRERFLASGSEAIEHGPHFLILLDYVQWELLTEARRAALIDHELMHCAVFIKLSNNRWRRFDPDQDQDLDERVWKFGLRAHDIEEFADVVLRHGFWKDDPHEQRFAEVARNLAPPHSANGTSRRKRQTV